MRKLFLLLVLPFIFFSCESDDDGKKADFIWNGDWNDPNDPNYVTGGYNPLEGTWRLTTNSRSKLIFTENFTILVARYGNNVRWDTLSYSQGKYIINNTAIKYRKNGRICIEEYEFEESPSGERLLYLFDDDNQDWLIFSSK